MGTWSFSYDAVDRLVSSTAGAGVPTGYQNLRGCWTYDAFGNRLSESVSTTACANSPVKQGWANYNATNNRITSSMATANFVYDVSGNTLWDGSNQYWYDAEGQLCAAQTWRSGSAGAVTQYVYDAEGARIATVGYNSFAGTTAATLQRAYDFLEVRSYDFH